jgi:hypothetical protein
MEPLDGNAIAGSLYEAFGAEMTARAGTCRSCGAIGPIAQLRVYLCAPGAVARCPACGSVVLVVIQRAHATDAHLDGIDLAAF